MFGFISRPTIECADGFRMSVQASAGHYCTPRENEGPYDEVEVGFPNKEEPLLVPYAEDASRLTQTVYPYVPLDTVIKVIQKHGGVSGEVTWDQMGLPVANSID